MDFFQVFVDLRKAFDTVICTDLWCILSRLGCPPHFFRILRSFHGGMEACANVGSVFRKPVKVENRVK